MTNTAVRIIERNNETSLVQWVENGKLCRAYLPNSEVTLDGKQSDRGRARAPHQGIEYGDDLEEAIGKLPAVTINQVVEALHQAGIWHLEDVAADPNRVVAAFQSVYRLQINTLLQAHRRKQLAKR
jgi:hypothetical protein